MGSLRDANQQKGEIVVIVDGIKEVSTEAEAERPKNLKHPPGSFTFKTIRRISRKNHRSKEK